MMPARHWLLPLVAALAMPPVLLALAQAPQPPPELGPVPFEPVPSSSVPLHPVPSGPVPSGPCERCGKIESIRAVSTRDQWTPLGSVVATSPLAGTNGSPSAVTMVKIEPGLSKQQQPVFIGAAGGAVYKTRPSEFNGQRWEVSVRMDDGGTRLVSQNYEPMLREGDRVRVLGTQLELVQ